MIDNKIDNESTTFENTKAYFKKINFDLEDFKLNYIIERTQINFTYDGHLIPDDYIIKDGNKGADTVIMVYGWGAIVSQTILLLKSI